MLSFEAGALAAGQAERAIVAPQWTSFDGAVLRSARNRGNFGNV
jgi:hypothetical protein